MFAYLANIDEDSSVTTPSNSTPADSAISSRVAGYGLFILTLVYAFNFIDRQILVILQEPIKLEMGLSDTQLGLLSGFYLDYFGANNLRYAMLTVGLLGSPAVLLFYLAARHLPGDLDRSVQECAVLPSGE